jgi:GDPmannose 4,6-dehydratase
VTLKILSNETHSIREFVELAFSEIGVSGYWSGDGLNEQYIIANHLLEQSNLKSSVLVAINSKFYRPAEVDLLWGDSTKARQELNWIPKTSFENLVCKMVKNDLDEL